MCCHSLLSCLQLPGCLAILSHSSDYPSSVEHDRFVRDVLTQLGLDGEIPSVELVTDYYVDFKTCTFKTWKERCDGMAVNKNGYATVPEVRIVSVSAGSDLKNQCLSICMDLNSSFKYCGSTCSLFRYFPYYSFPTLCCCRINPFLVLWCRCSRPATSLRCCSLLATMLYCWGNMGQGRRNL